ncbi:MAG: H-NS family nucleoid-associated regulatory protein [Moraxellaceae bacterium]
MSINLDNLTIAELDAIIVQAAELIEKKKAQALVDAKAEIAKIAAATGMSVEELLGLKVGKAKKVPGAAKKPVADKYRNPKDYTQTWSGRGKRPRWLQEILDKGGKLENFLIV